VTRESKSVRSEDLFKTNRDRLGASRSTEERGSREIHRVNRLGKKPGRVTVRTGGDRRGVVDLQRRRMWGMRVMGDSKKIGRSFKKKG